MESIKRQYTAQKVSLSQLSSVWQIRVSRICFHPINVWKPDQTFGDLTTLTAHPYKLHEYVYERVNMHA